MSRLIHFELAFGQREMAALIVISLNGGDVAIIEIQIFYFLNAIYKLLVVQRILDADFLNGDVRASKNIFASGELRADGRSVAA